MRKILVLLLVGLSINGAYADGWRGGERWHGGEGMGWAIGSALMGGVIGGMMAQQAPVYMQPGPMMVPPGYMPMPQPAYGYPQPTYVQPMYPAPYYYGGRRWDDD